MRGWKMWENLGMKGWKNLGMEGWEWWEILRKREKTGNVEEFGDEGMGNVEKDGNAGKEQFWAQRDGKPWERSAKNHGKKPTETTKNLGNHPKNRETQLPCGARTFPRTTPAAPLSTPDGSHPIPLPRNPAGLRLPGSPAAPRRTQHLGVPGGEHLPAGAGHQLDAGRSSGHSGGHSQPLHPNGRPDLCPVFLRAGRSGGRRRPRLRGHLAEGQRHGGGLLG